MRSERFNSGHLQEKQGCTVVQAENRSCNLKKEMKLAHHLLLHPLSPFDSWSSVAISYSESLGLTELLSSCSFFKLGTLPKPPFYEFLGNGLPLLPEIDFKVLFHSCQIRGHSA